MALSRLDQQIGVAAQNGDWATVEKLGARVLEDFWETPEGQRLCGCANRSVIPQRLLEEFHRRFDEDPLYPGTFFVFRFQQIAEDLLRSEAYAAEQVEESHIPTEREVHEAKVAELRAMMSDPLVHSSEIKRLRESSPEYRRAWTDACALDVQSSAPHENTDQFKKLRQFAHLVNESVLSRGASSIRPVAGLVTLHAGDKKYEFPVLEFRNQLESATIAGLIA